MGFKRKTYKLKWPEGHDLHGLEIRLAGMNMEELQTLASMKEAAQEAQQSKDISQITPLFDLFADKLISWNYEEDDGTPIAATAEEVRKLDITVFIPAVLGWTDAVASVASPLKKSSSSGEVPQGVSIPMEVLSPNLPS